MRLPYVTELDGVDFAIVGVPFDTGGTYRVGCRVSLLLRCRTNHFY